MVPPAKTVVQNILRAEQPRQVFPDSPSAHAAKRFMTREFDGWPRKQ